MAITLSYNNGNTVIVLHPDLFWVDEHSWTPVQQMAERSLTGAMLIDYALKTSGREITLQPEDGNSAWINRATLDSLKIAAAIPGLEMSLSINGTTYSVVFRHLDGALDVVPVVHYNDSDPNDWFSVTLRFLEI